MVYIIHYPVAGRWCADLTGPAQAKCLFGQLPFYQPRPQPSKLPKNRPGFRAEITALIKVGQSRNSKSWQSCSKAVRKRPCSAVKGPNVAHDF